MASSILLEQLRGHSAEQSFDLPAVSKGLAQQRREFPGDVATAATPVLLHREDERRMPPAAGARGALRPNAGLAHFGHRALGGRPEVSDLLKESLPLPIRRDMRCFHA